MNKNFFIVKIDNKVICQGKILYTKNRISYKSFFDKNNLHVFDILAVSNDNIHFFNVNSKNKYMKIIFTDDYIENIYFNLIELNKKIKFCEWMKTYKYVNNGKVNYIDLFIEKDIDIEIKDIIEKFNSLGIKTVGSCSGHNKKHAYINIKFDIYSKESKNMLLKLIESICNTSLNESICLKTDKSVNHIDKECYFLRLETYNKGEEAWASLKKLCFILERTL